MAVTVVRYILSGTSGEFTYRRTSNAPEMRLGFRKTFRWGCYSPQVVNWPEGIGSRLGQRQLVLSLVVVPIVSYVRIKKKKSKAKRAHIPSRAFPLAARQLPKMWCLSELEVLFHRFRYLTSIRRVSWDAKATKIWANTPLPRLKVSS